MVFQKRNFIKGERWIKKIVSEGKINSAANFNKCDNKITRLSGFSDLLMFKSLNAFTTTVVTIKLKGLLCHNTRT